MWTIVSPSRGRAAGLTMPEPMPASLASLFGLLVLWALLAVSGCGRAGDEEARIVSAVSVPVRGVFEAWIDTPVDVENPFDPSHVSIECVFEAPDGRTFRVPAYVTREYRRDLVQGYERLSETGDLFWQVRFTPVQEGVWHWYWERKAPFGAETSSISRFLATGPAPPSRRGFVRVSSEDPHYLEFDDGTPYFAVGENLCWYDGRGTFAYDDWLAKLASQGVNYVRLWMPSWAFGLEWTQRDEQGTILGTTLGNYTGRLDRAWQLDYVIHRLEELGIYAMLCIQNHGPFSTIHNSEWADNPYNAACGGPLANPRDFFTSTEAKELFKRRLRYIVSRWGYSQNILAWELWNEVDLVEQPTMEELLEWHREMAATLRSLDPFPRLVTTSLSGTPTIVNLLTGSALYGPLWELPDIDLVQIHFYSIGWLPVPLADIFPAMTEMARSYGKPVLIAEAGVDFRGPEETLAADPESVAIHDMLWSGIFSQTCGTGMTWWWDNLIDPQGLYGHFGPVSSFVGDLRFPRGGFEGGCAQPVPRSGKGLAVYSLCGGDVVLAWIKNSRHQWYHPDPGVVNGSRVLITGRPDGRWTARWIDTSTGGMVAESELLIAGGATEIEVPAFVHDIALRLEKVY
jgi:hypothetical protein